MTGGRRGNAVRMNAKNEELLRGALKTEGPHRFWAESEKIRGDVPAAELEAYDRAVNKLAETLGVTTDSPFQGHNGRGKTR